jgi:hypothetical protein
LNCDSGREENIHVLELDDFGDPDRPDGSHPESRLNLVRGSDLKGRRNDPNVAHQPFHRIIVDRAPRASPLEDPAFHRRSRNEIISSVSRGARIKSVLIVIGNEAELLTGRNEASRGCIRCSIRST